ncbi:MAG: methionyl-tRNA formyltransferase [Luteolibacter sp.]
MRIIFMATGEIAVPALERLIAEGMVPLALVTQPDRPVGRHQHEALPPPVKPIALAAGIPVFQPEHANDAVPELAILNPEVVVVMAYGQILKRPVLELADRAIINLHASLLPKYRGAACIQAAIDAGDHETGVTAIHVVRKLDAGDIIHARSIPILENDTGGTMHEKLAALAPDVLIESLGMLADGSAPRIPQNQRAVSHVGKLLREDGCIDWSRPAVEIERRIRAYDPWPGSFTTFTHRGRVKRLKIFPTTEPLPDDGFAQGVVRLHEDTLWVGCGAGSLKISEVQPEGGKRMSACEFAHGHDLASVGG